MSNITNSFIESCSDCSLAEVQRETGKDLLVCQCFNVYESTIKQVVDDGAQSVSDVTKACQAGGGCSACHVRIERILRGIPAKCGRRADIGKTPVLLILIYFTDGA